jgi:transposase
MIAALQVENSQMSATLRAHELLVQSLRIRIAKLQKQKFGASSEKIEREIKQLELALEDLQVATAEADTTAHDESDGADAVVTAAEPMPPKPRRRPRVSDTTPRERRELDPGDNCPDCASRPIALQSPAGQRAVICASWGRMSASCST